jgi:hypothetical protein
MPRLKPPPKKEQELPIIEDQALPTEPIEIELQDEGDGSVEVELKQPDIKPAPKVEEPNALQAALDAQKRAEELQRTAQRERDEAIRNAQTRDREREAEIARERQRSEEAEYNSVLTAIAAEQSTADKAEADMATALAAQDYAAAAKAQRILSAATARLDRLEDGKQAFDSRRDQAKAAPQVTRNEQPAPQPQDFEGRLAQFPDPAKQWLRKHPEFLNDQNKTREIAGVHDYLTNRKGLAQFSDAYFAALDEEFGFHVSAPVQAEIEPAAQPQRRSMPMSAPVSREAPTASGKKPGGAPVRLTPEEVFVARNSFTATDMTNEQKEYLYAQNKAKLAKKRASGEYRMTTEQTG